MKIFKYFLIIITTITLLQACKGKDDAGGKIQEDSLSALARDSTKKFEYPKPDTFPLITYKKIYVSNYKMLSSILKQFPQSEKNFDTSRIIKTLNRKELRLFRIGDSIVVPDTIIPDLRAYSVFPQYYPEARDIPKIILVSNAMQCYACYEYGKQVKFSAANTGKERTPTFPGRYGLVWRQLKRISSINEEWILPFTWNFHAEAGNAFHQFIMPGRPVSHSCIRQFMEDAKWLYYWGNGAKRDSVTGRFIPYSGTPMIIIDYFDFNRKRYGPWLDIKSNAEGILQIPKDPMHVEEALIPIIQIPKTSRSVLINKQRYITAEDTLRARGIIRPNVKLTPTIDFNKQRQQKAGKKNKPDSGKTGQHR